MVLLRKKMWLPLGLYKQEAVSLVWIALAVCFVLGMVVQPKIVYEGSINGLKAWWNIVFPSLLPFFIASEILMKLGLVRFMGVLLEPVMRPLFNVPGAGAFVMVIGFTSGFPIGSMVTAKLRQQGLCSRVEAERLMSFTNNSSPLFMLTAVAVGMFGRPDLGVVIAGSHYLANLLLGFLLRFYGRKEPQTNNVPPAAWSLKQSFRVLLQQTSWERQPLGQLLGDAVASSVSKLLNIGGFIILFAVIIRLLQHAGIIDLLATLLGLLLVPLGVSPEILTALASGLFEMTIGTKMASEAAAPELQRLMAVAMILGWSGLSIHAQVASMIAKTDLRMGLFVFTRIAHAALATLFTLVFYRSGGSDPTTVLPVLAPLLNTFSHSPVSVVTLSLITLLISLLFFILLGLTLHILWRLGKIFYR
ncbi:MAG: sporulation integral membrane protein YlbJ [Bacillota bacterium]